MYIFFVMLILLYLINYVFKENNIFYYMIYNKYLLKKNNFSLFYFIKSSVFLYDIFEKGKVDR